MSGPIRRIAGHTWLNPLESRERRAARRAARGMCRCGACPKQIPSGLFRNKETSAEPAGKPGFVVDSHSSRPDVAVRLKQPTRERRGPRQCSPIRSCSRWGLPCHAALSPRAVRSYRTISTLPDPLRAIGGMFSVALIRRLAPPRRYLAPCPVEPGLSSAPLRVTRLSGRLRTPF